MDSGRSYDWVEVNHKKTKKSYAEMVNFSSSPLTRANKIPLGTSFHPGPGTRRNGNQETGHFFGCSADWEQMLSFSVDFKTSTVGV